MQILRVDFFPSLPLFFSFRFDQKGKKRVVNLLSVEVERRFIIIIIWK